MLLSKSLTIQSRWLFKFKDETAHRTGPDKDDYMEAIREADEFLNGLMVELKQTNIYKNLNIVLVGDHGFASLNPNHSIALSKFIDLNYINLTRSVVNIVSSIYPIKGYVSAHPTISSGMTPIESDIFSIKKKSINPY